MAGYFNKLRKKPKHVRDNIAFSIAGGLTFMIAVAWFFVGFSNPVKTPQISNEETNGAFSTLLEQIQEQVATAREGVTEGDESTSTTPASNGEWGLSAQSASSTNTTSGTPKEAAIMIVNASSSTRMSSSTASTSVLY